MKQCLMSHPHCSYRFRPPYAFMRIYYWYFPCGFRNSLRGSHVLYPRAWEHLPLTPPTSLSHCYCIDHNNVCGDTPFHGHSSRTELHKPFTTRSPWWMAGPQAKAPGPDRSASLSDKCHQKDIRHLPISYSFKWEYVCDRKREIKNTQGFVKPWNDLQQFGRVSQFVFCWGLR